MISGVLTGVVGMALAVCAAVGILVGWWWWVVAVCCLAAAGFQVFEARKGWCVMRAIGVKTPM